MVGIIGRMSGGKTYFAVELMLGALATGHCVVTNVILNCQAVSSFLGVPCVQWKRLYFRLVESNPKGFNVLLQSDYDSFPTGSPRGTPSYDARLVYIVLDEVSSIFDSMIHSSDSNIQKVATWARHSHKRGQELVLIMQFANELHKRLRVHINEYVNCSNSGTWRLPLVGWRLPGPLRHFSVRSRYADDCETRIGNNSWVLFDPRIYRCYNTAQIVVGASVPIKPIVVDLDNSALVEWHNIYYFKVLSGLFLLILCCSVVALCLML